MQYMQRWHHLYSQASEQSSNTSVINRQVMFNSTSNVTILSAKQPDDVLMQVYVSRCVRHNDAFTVVRK